MFQGQKYNFKNNLGIYEGGMTFWWKIKQSQGYLIIIGTTKNTNQFEKY
jgi:hypothetical protein